MDTIPEIVLTLQLIAYMHGALKRKPAGDAKTISAGCLSNKKNMNIFLQHYMTHDSFCNEQEGT